jgi:uncharacterized protein (TIGR03032 family)
MTDASRGSTRPTLEFSSSADFAGWLSDQRVSLAFTTYEACKLFLVGLQPDGRLNIFERTFNRSMGLCVDRGQSPGMPTEAQSLWMSSLYQLWRFENLLPANQQHHGYDRVYIPQVGYTTGEINIHDMAVDQAGRIVFVNTLFSCLATVSTTHSFTPIWKPPFITQLAAEDRCHLNGMALQDGRPRYVTAVAATDTAEGWRDHRQTGGILIDCEQNAVVISGLSMPHSPRIYHDQLWLLDAGSGYFGRADCDRGSFEGVTFCPGYLRGLSFADDYAVVATSRPRGSETFAGLALQDRLKDQKMDAHCQISVIDLRSGELVHWLRAEGFVNELYDVVVLPQVRRPMALGFKTEEIQRMISISEALSEFRK